MPDAVFRSMLMHICAAQVEISSPEREKNEVQAGLTIIRYYNLLTRRLLEKGKESTPSRAYLVASTRPNPLQFSQVSNGRLE
jgi:hypothetical protein